MRSPGARRALALVSAALAAGALGCGTRQEARDPVAETEAPGAQRPIEMFAWLERIGEEDPLAALAAAHRRAHPDDSIINARAALSGLARKTLQARMQRNEPPDTFQANVGGDLMQWVLSNGTDARESKLLPLDDVLAKVPGWREAIPRELLEQVTYDGKVYGVPANIHRNNEIFYNKKLLARFGFKEPTSINDLVAMGERLRGTGVSLFGLGSNAPWTVALFVDCLMVARDGPEFYHQYFSGLLDADDPRMVHTLETALQLLAYANPDHQQLSWLQGIDLVTEGRAVMTVMGEWARGPFNARGLRLGVDYGEIPFPQTADVFVFSADAFVLPAAAKNRAGAERLLATLASPDGQRAISRARGTLTARIDVPPPAGDPVLEENYALLKKHHLVPAAGGVMPARFQSDLDAALGEMLAQHDVDPVVHMLRSRYVLLQ
ncbi:MAG TPA: ABC transporter substrate-binding protein [Polyangia bacterium]|nr:ABC transporter substrate-binding protein [Polyangia bacterium]